MNQAGFALNRGGFALNRGGFGLNQSRFALNQSRFALVPLIPREPEASSTVPCREASTTVPCNRGKLYCLQRQALLSLAEASSTVPEASSTVPCKHAAETQRSDIAGYYMRTLVGVQSGSVMVRIERQVWGCRIGAGLGL